MNATTLTARRVFEGLSQEQFAMVLGYRQATIGMVESGRRDPSPRLIGKVARHFPITDEFIYFLNEYERLKKMSTLPL